MEQIYFPELTQNLKNIVITGEEARHLKVLRISIGEKILVSNGKGLSALALVKDIEKANYILEIFEFYHNLNEINKKIALAIGIISSRERFEFALEKATELGISEFFPLITTYSQKKFINIERLKAKSISAFKQSKRSVLPKIYNPVEIGEIQNFIDEYDIIIFADESGEKPHKLPENSNIIIFIGPEGGFTQDEINYISNLTQFSKKVIKWKLAESRLRSETAGIVAVALALQL